MNIVLFDRVSLVLCSLISRKYSRASKEGRADLCEADRLSAMLALIKIKRAQHIGIQAFALFLSCNYFVRALIANHDVVKT